MTVSGPLRFKIDENVPAEAALVLRAAGHDSLTVADQRLGGSSDEVISTVCMSEARAMITLDLDFADIRRHPPESLPGIIVLRLVTQDRARVLEAVRMILPRLQTEPLAGTLWIVEETAVRVRGPSPR